MVLGLLEINKATLPPVYLGIPPFFGRACHPYFNKVLESIRLRPAGWKTKLLSFARRLIMVRHVLSSIPLYVSLVLPLPIKTYLVIKRLMRKFLWFANPERLKSNLVKWEAVCLPRSEAGLGLRRVKEFNEAYLLKLAWLVSTSNSLWPIWFRERYLKGLAIWHPKFQRGGSYICKSIRSFSSLIQRKSRWVIGNGHSISLWFDRWIDQVLIAARFPSLQFSDLNLVADIIGENSRHIPNHLPTQLKHFLALSTNSISIGSCSEGDLLQWKDSTSGDLSIKEAWNLLRTRVS